MESSFIVGIRSAYGYGGQFSHGLEAAVSTIKRAFASSSVVVMLRGPRIIELYRRAFVEQSLLAVMALAVYHWRFPIHPGTCHDRPEQSPIPPGPPSCRHCQPR
jgi:hypothetical protein